MQKICKNCNQSYVENGDFCEACNKIKDKQIQEKTRLLSTIEVLAMLKGQK